MAQLKKPRLDVYSAQVSEQRTAHAGGGAGDERVVVCDAGRPPDCVSPRAVRAVEVAQKCHCAGIRCELWAAVTAAQAVPLRRQAIIQKLVVQSGGLTGKIATLLAQAAKLAIRQKTDSISLDLLVEAAAARIFKFPAEQEIDDAPA